MERLPERLHGDLVDLVRLVPEDAESMAELIAANVDHLRDRMAWVAFEPLSIEARRELLESWDEAWRAGGDAVYRIEVDGVAAGGCGLHARIGPGALEIGYWVDHRFEGRGVATAASAMLTDAAFGDPSIEAVEIHHDRGNLASRRVPEKLGYRWVGERPVDRPLAPADCGVDGIWRIERAEWAGRSALPDGPASS